MLVGTYSGDGDTAVVVTLVDGRSGLLGGFDEDEVALALCGLGHDEERTMEGSYGSFLGVGGSYPRADVNR